MLSLLRQERPNRLQSPTVEQGEASPLHHSQGAGLMTARRIHCWLRVWSVGWQAAVRNRHLQAAGLMTARRIRCRLRVWSVEQPAAVRNRHPMTLTQHLGAAVVGGLDLRVSSVILRCLTVRLMKAALAA